MNTLRKISPRNYAKQIVAVMFFAIAALLVGSMALAQSNAGRISGSVTDQSGAAVANASVAVTNVQTGVARNLVTDQSGQYVAPDLLPGTYSGSRRAQRVQNGGCRQTSCWRRDETSA